MKRKFIINSISGKGIGEDEMFSLQKYYKNKNEKFECVVPGSRDETISLVRDSLRDGVEHIVVVGGDGTVNAAVNGFFENNKPVNSNACLALAKAGTGSDYYRGLVDGKRGIDWRELVLKHEVKSVDLGYIQFATPHYAGKYFMNMASVGMTAEIARKKEKAPAWLPRKLSYIVPTLSSLFMSKPQRVKIELDTDKLEIDVLAISISKGTYAGGGMKFGEKVSLFDGLFEITLFEPMNPLTMLTKLKRIYSGSAEGVKGVQKYRSSRILIKSDTAIPVEFDGEVYGETDIEVSVKPKALRVCFPV